MAGDRRRAADAIRAHLRWRWKHRIDCALASEGVIEYQRCREGAVLRRRRDAGHRIHHRSRSAIQRYRRCQKVKDNVAICSSRIRCARE